MGIIYYSSERQLRPNERERIGGDREGEEGISARRSLEAIVFSDRYCCLACRSDRLTGLEADAALGNKKPYYTSYRVVFTMTSSKIADGVTRDTSYLAYLTITFHTSPIHNIFIVRIADPITRGYEIIDMRTIATKYPFSILSRSNLPVLFPKSRFPRLQFTRGIGYPSNASSKNFSFSSRETRDLCRKD